ncbi:MAG: hypothetical protein CMJ75_16035 [Planctomycetaceae bacterium]|nr:hypothetical protein [Planctomycetaceae bacterium]
MLANAPLGVSSTQLAASQALSENAVRFDREVAPILATHCLRCHQGTSPKGGLDLSRRATALAGGESGSSITPGNPATSLLLQRVDAGEMPPDKPLSAAARQRLRDWITNGATWGTAPIQPTAARRAGKDWWSLQPLTRPGLPATQHDDWVRNPIDAFILRRLRDAQLTPTPSISPLLLMRRLSFDLLGLPPTPEQVLDFASHPADDLENRLERTLDRLLSSRHFGERWARHWLDIVRFGESQGFERDKLRPHSYHYRDWVVEAMNQDMPYNLFARLQIAGDVLAPNDPQAVIATGFLVAGAYDEVGQAQQSQAMRAVVRQDELEDVVGTLGQTFLGLTVQCARCHDHKFDPIGQQEYYRLTAAMAGVRHGVRHVISPAAKQRQHDLNQELTHLRRQLQSLEKTAQNRLLTAHTGLPENRPVRVQPVTRWDFDENQNDRFGKAHAIQHPAARRDDGALILDRDTGYAATHPIEFTLQAKTLEAWVRLANLEQRGGSALTVQYLDGQKFDAIVFGEQQPRHWMAGSEGYLRSRPFSASAETTTNAPVHVAITYQTDGTVTAYRNGKPYGRAYRTSKPLVFPAGKWMVLFGLRHGAPEAEKQMQGLLDCAQIYNRALTPAEVETSYLLETHRISRERAVAALSPVQQNQYASLRATIQLREKSLKEVKAFPVYAVAPRPAEVTHVLARGNPTSPGKVVSAGGVAAVPGPSADFGLAPQASDSARRNALAQWVTDNRNPLFSRVIVNRLWHYHFGTGLVSTPNDFGYNGGRPSHPELLDWLASELVTSNWSLKHVHRLIVTSATYRQDSLARPECLRRDADNRLLWRRSPQRLEAEALRDTLLCAAGQLNRQLGGPPYQDFTTFVSNSQFYRMTDPVGAPFNRRTIYRTWLRSGRNAFLDAFDCPDPATTAPRRAVTTTPTQSLALLNNSFVLRMAQRMVERITREAGPRPREQAAWAILLAYSRTATEEDLTVAAQFIREHGLAAYCRVLFNTNEFLYID